MAFMVSMSCVGSRAGKVTVDLGRYPDIGAATYVIFNSLFNRGYASDEIVLGVGSKGYPDVFRWSDGKRSYVVVEC